MRRTKKLAGRWVIVFMTFTLFITSAFNAHASDTDELLNFLTEKGVIKQGDAASFKEELAKKQEQTGEHKGFDLTAGIPLKISSFAQVRYQYPENAAAGFDIHRARLDFNGNITDRIDYRLQPAFEGSSAKLLDAYMDYEVGHYLIFTGGQSKIPFSKENLTPSKVMEMIDRPEVVQTLVLGNQIGRDIGMKAGGKFLKLSDTYLFEYALGIFNGQGINTPDLNDQKDYVGRLLIHPINGLSFGGGYYTGRNALYGITGSSYEHTMVGAELVYIHDPISLRAEYIKGKDGSKKGTTSSQGWYIQGAHFFLEKRLQCALRYEAYDPDINVSNNTSSIYTIGLNWFFTTLTRIQVDYEIKDVEGAKKNSNLLTAQLQVGF